MPSTYKVFISHSSKDRVPVEALVSLLADPIGIQHRDVFATSADGTGITSGEDWREAIRGALWGSSVIILVVSEHYRKSEICMNEMGAAWMSDAWIIPVLLPPISFDSVGVLAEIKQVEYLTKSKGIDHLRDTLVNKLNMDAGSISSDRWTTKKEEFLTKLDANAGYQTKTELGKPDGSYSVSRLSSVISTPSGNLDRGLVDSMNRVILAEASTGTFETLDARVLKEPAGSVSLWLRVTKEHSAPSAKSRHMYLIAHDSERGAKADYQGTERYLNVWAISRVLKQGIAEWRFTITNKNGTSPGTHFTDRRPMSIGWHMFSVTWSSLEKQIVFYVDGKKQRSGEFNYWPDNVTDTFTIGTWGEGASKVYYINSEVGHVRCYNRKLNDDEVLELFTTSKPE